MLTFGPLKAPFIPGSPGGFGAPKLQIPNFKPQENFKLQIAKTNFEAWG